ncbi:hypothetical protein GOP47_0027426 [Adiantum capillus-veneris]|nr:hypothetical protein GOP47_0027426 [Adiantum capillus-veneris]
MALASLRLVGHKGYPLGTKPPCHFQPSTSPTSIFFMLSTFHTRGNAIVGGRMQKEEGGKAGSTGALLSADLKKIKLKKGTFPSAGAHVEICIHQLWFPQLHIRKRAAASTSVPLRSRLPASRAEPMTKQQVAAPRAKTHQQQAGGQVTLTALVTVGRKRNPGLEERLLDKVDSLSDVSGQKVVLQLVSTELDPQTGVGKRSTTAVLLDWVQKASINADKVQYIAEFKVSNQFGLPGAITIVNNHQNEFFLETIAIKGLPSGTLYFSCYSWVQSKFKNPKESIFFTNHVYLPSETPEGLKDLRERDMLALRGNGKGTRKAWENVYDYDVYNDIGNPDKDKNLVRPTLGGSGEHKYPRRCRTGRPATKADPNAESVLEIGTNYYVPRDEAFEQAKQETFIGNTLKGVVHQQVPSLSNSMKEGRDEFQSFHDIDNLYREGVKLRKFEPELGFLQGLPINQIIEKVEQSANQASNLLQYAEPSILSKDRFAWMRDEEFGRQAVAGANPVHIERLQEFPPRSSLDEETYGCAVSAIRAEHLLGRLEGLTVQEAMNQGRLFVLDYHDAFMSFINKINALEGRKMYASRTILFYTGVGTLLPIAIELSLPPPSKGAPVNRRVFTPSSDSSSHWKWQLAKAHVRSNDAGYHQLVNHWLRSHATVEPYVIASHRQLSKMHPVFTLLQPHFRYTLEINASARQLLINADGVIENCFTPGPFSLEISSAAYKSLWRFDQESLPADLLRRGMAIEDPHQENGLQLVIEDYPYASDGILVWNAITKWVDEYVSLYYKDDKVVEGDVELQAWWDEIKNTGHEDKKGEAWWPQLKTPQDLKSILSTIIWITSGFHAAINFGQYDYAGYVPNRPCMTRRLIPEDGDFSSFDYHEFSQNPGKFFLSTIPNHLQATTLMAVVDTLSSHSPDEEYLGTRTRTNWTQDQRAKEAFKRFSTSISEVEYIIGCKNRDPALKSRHGAGVLSYELLMPKLVPNSISI